jgi:hypothetical protein
MAKLTLLITVAYRYAIEDESIKLLIVLEQ